MITGVDIWFKYAKENGSSSNIMYWTGQANTNDAIKAINRIKAQDMLKMQSSWFFSQDVTLSISMKEIATGKVLYRRTL